MAGTLCTRDMAMAPVATGRTTWTNCLTKACFAFLLLAIAVTAGSARGEPIRIGVPPWQGAVVKSAVIATILQQEGFEVETISAAAPLVFQELAQGRLDFNVSAWVPGQDEAFMPLVERGEIAILGENLTGAATGLAVPVAIHAEGIESIEDLDEHGSRFGRTIHCIEPGSGANRVAEQAVKDDLYGLGDWRVLPSSTEAMLSQLERSLRRGVPMVFCAWRPHWMNVAHDIRYLADPLEHWGGPDRTRVYTLARRGLREDHPELVEFLEAFRVSARTQSEWIHRYAQDNRDPDVVAREWVDDNPETVSAWLSHMSGGPG